ncbi:hypothetical protein L3X07_09150 [Levilactobacillus brevis]|nr:hypothetical protein [Levilactobacillus brevis]
MPQLICGPNALVLAGLVADGYTQVTNLKYLDRGYYDFHKKLAALGAEVKRVSVPDNDAVVLKNSHINN